MPVDKIPNDATLLGLTGKRDQREEYVRRVLANFYKLGPGKDAFLLRIGTQGKGHSPHYKLECPVVDKVQGGPEGASQQTFVIYNGLNHEEMTAFEIRDTRDEHWSSKTMTFSEVESYLRDLRTFK